MIFKLAVGWKNLLVSKRLISLVTVVITINYELNSNLELACEKLKKKKTPFQKKQEKNS